MLYGFLADGVVLLHLAFVVFATLGGLLVLRWRWIAWVHVPAVVWAAAVEFADWICPLTPLEIWLRRHGGQSGYPTGFVEHYILPILYPAELTRQLRFLLGSAVLLVNVAVYCVVVARARGAKKR